ncbi:glycosyltransferase family 4 protein [Yangia sp. PrR007]|uniref:glycosyltransferase family 4 protein n=1 Tax=Salipiger sp. PrR003 TaxID=2706776 RepID=UPI0013BBB191|nr:MULTISPECIES: glycosyltransferase family 1 protein [unclassified Salipiger]NDV50693.1 glycosyltransferase family 4 protein [Salipiger sp. PrR003]NDW33137.1 glycosyltransferase family 4 protein [Salipiger sp. PrR007]
MGTTITETNPPARLLDLTRLVSRAGRVRTGVDRVEYAYLGRLLQEPVPLFGLVRTSLGYLLLDGAGCRALKRRLDAGDWPEPDVLGRLARRRDPRRAGAETALRASALARAIPATLGRMLRRHLPAGAVYLNTGHSNFSEQVVAALHRVEDSRIAVLLHDTIPLDWPQFQRAGSAQRFASFLQRVAENADLVICNSEVTRADMTRHLGPPLLPKTVVAHLGVQPHAIGIPPEGPWANAPYFVVLGTIEPRKNHALLLDIWRELTPPAHLLICGARGWNNTEVFAALDAGIANVHELPGLNDAEIAGLLARSAGLLFPSHAEGYGLPPVEAAALGVPVLAAPLPVLREVLGDIPIYADESDRYLWAARIRQMAKGYRAQPDEADATQAGYLPPTWDSHFKAVLTLI